MIIIKLIALGSIVGSCSYIGNTLAEKATKRLEQVTDMDMAINLLKTEIVYMANPVGDALDNVHDKVNDPLKKLIKALADKLIKGEAYSIYEGFATSYNEVKDFMKFDEKDMNVLKDFFMSLGGTETYGQEQIFEITSTRLAERKADAEKEAVKNNKLYRTLGIAIGLCLAMLFA